MRLTTYLARRVAGRCACRGDRPRAWIDQVVAGAGEEPDAARLIANLAHGLAVRAVEAEDREPDDGLARPDRRRAGAGEALDERLRCLRAIEERDGGGPVERLADHRERGGPDGLELIDLLRDHQEIGVLL